MPDTNDNVSDSVSGKPDSRRDFLKLSALKLGTVLGSGLTLKAWAQSPLKILVLGGTGFIGPNMVRYAVDRGHEVSIFTRGRSQADIPDVEQLIGDRNDDYSALRFPGIFLALSERVPVRRCHNRFWRRSRFESAHGSSRERS